MNQSGQKRMKTLVLGLGNPILTDDGVGFAVVEEVGRRVNRKDVTVSQASVGALGLLELVVGYDKVIILDAIQTEDGEPGHIHRLSPAEFRGNLRAASSHEVSFATALELGRQLSQALPKELVILAIEAKDVDTFGEQLTPPVAAAVPEVVELVLQELRDESAARSTAGTLNSAEKAPSTP
jgi:hydrogenase maturation protease